MIREADVREKLTALWRKEISLEAFEDWLAQASWSMHNDSKREAVDLVSSIHLLLAERDDHVINEAELRREFLALLNNVSVSFRIEPDAVVSSVRNRYASSSSVVSISLVGLSNWVPIVPSASTSLAAFVPARA